MACISTMIPMSSVHCVFNTRRIAVERVSIAISVSENPDEFVAQDNHLFRFTNLVRVGKRYLIVKVSGSGHVHYLPHLVKEGCSHSLMALCTDSHVPSNGW